MLNVARARPLRAKLLLVSCLSLHPVCAGAQQASAASSPKTGIEEIVVTAQRVSESLQKAAIPVTAVLIVAGALVD